MEEDVQNATHIYQMDELENLNKGGAVQFTYNPTDRVGRFQDGYMILAPLSAFNGFFSQDDMVS